MHQRPQRRPLERSKPQRRQGPRATYQATPAPATRRPQGPRKEHGQTARQPPATRPANGPPARAKERGQGTHQPPPITPPAATETATAGKVCTKASKTAARRATLDTSHNRKRGDGGASLAKTQGTNGPHRTKAGRIPNGRRPAGCVPGLNDLNGCAPNT